MLGIYSLGHLPDAAVNVLQMVGCFRRVAFNPADVFLHVRKVGLNIRQLLRCCRRVLLNTLEVPFARSLPTEIGSGKPVALSRTYSKSVAVGDSLSLGAC